MEQLLLALGYIALLAIVVSDPRTPTQRIVDELRARRRASANSPRS